MAQAQVHYPQSARRVFTVSRQHRHEIEQVVLFEEESQGSVPRKYPDLGRTSNPKPPSTISPPPKNPPKDVSNPAPNNTESLFYLARDVVLSYQQYPGVPKIFKMNEFFGGTSRLDILPIDFVLFYGNDDRFFDVRISDVISDDRLGKKPSLCLSRFQQAEISFQFLRKEKDAKNYHVIHNEPPMKISLELPNGRRLSNELSGKGHKAFDLDQVIAICRNVVPVDVVEHLAPTSLLLKFEMKLMKGEPNVLHGIQKSFLPDKLLFDLKHKMECLLLEGYDADTVVICGDNTKYRAHQSILCANSEVYKAMFASKMKETRTRTVHTPDYIKSNEMAAMLKYMYARNSFDLQQCPRLTTNVLRSAHEHQMELLMEVCEEAILGMPSTKFDLESILYTFQAACLLDKVAIQTKCVHLVLKMDLKLSKSETYIEFLQRDTEIAAQFTDMIVHFQKHLSDKKCD